MFLYLVQHGIAEDKSVNPERPLSDEGKSELLRMMKFLEIHPIVQADNVFHSGKLRARQTALLLADAIKPSGGVEEEEGLAPMDDPAIWAGRLRDMYQDIMLVGHLPHLPRLASLLLTGDTEVEPVYFRNGGIICLNRHPDNRWTVDWIITPELLKTR
jgi:phosphohistidine phosphatase